jgi:hypothetical protein
MLNHLVHFICSNEDVLNVSGVDITVGGDHGIGYFRMILNLVVRHSSNKPPFSKLFQIASVDYKKDDIKILSCTVLKKKGDS